MKAPWFQVDTFTQTLFSGNPAAVVVLPEWIEDERLQAIATENNLSETAFVVENPKGFDLRWFTPAVEVDLCGHATLAAAFALFEHGFAEGDALVFQSASGPLAVRREGGLLAMDFPARPPVPVDAMPELTEALGAEPAEIHASRDLLAVFATQREVEGLAPDLAAVSRLDTFAVIASAPGEAVDFVSRFFAPQKGVPEDPVTGSSHCTLVPYWAKRLGKQRLHARQLSARGGELFCELMGTRVKIAGHAIESLRGEIRIR